MDSRIVEVKLPNGTVALVQAADEGGGPSAQKVGFQDVFDLEGLSATLDGVAQAIRSGLARALPSRTTVELGIDLAVKNGHLTGLIVNGQASASLKVTLEWGRGAADGDAG